MKSLRFSKVHPAEVSNDCLQALGFSADGGHFLYAVTL
jgi:hypothetical protein